MPLSIHPGGNYTPPQLKASVLDSDIVYSFDPGLPPNSRQEEEEGSPEVVVAPMLVWEGAGPAGRKLQGSKAWLQGEGGDGDGAVEVASV